MFRFTAASTEEVLDVLGIASKRYKEILDPTNEIDAYCIRAGFEVMNLEGTFSYPHGGYLAVDDIGQPVGFAYKEFEDTFKVENPTVFESISGSIKFKGMGAATAPEKGPDAIADDKVEAPAPVAEALDTSVKPVVKESKKSRKANADIPE